MALINNIWLLNTARPLNTTLHLLTTYMVAQRRMAAYNRMNGCRLGAVCKVVFLTMERHKAGSGEPLLVTPLIFLLFVDSLRERMRRRTAALPNGRLAE